MRSYLSLITIRSNNLDSAAAFYSRLGLQFAKHRHGSGPEHYCAEADGVAFEIYPLREHDVPTVSTRLGFRAVEISSVLKDLVRAGGKILSPPTQSPWGLRAVLCDPDGHKVELQQASVAEL